MKGPLIKPWEPGRERHRLVKGAVTPCWDCGLCCGPMPVYLFWVPSEEEVGFLCQACNEVRRQESRAMKKKAKANG